MEQRQRHWMIELQRANRVRPVTYALDEDGDEIRHVMQKGQVTRAEFFAEKHVERRHRKREATRTNKQRSDNMRAGQRQLAAMRARFADPRQIVVTDKTGLIQVPKKKHTSKQKGGWKRRASGLLVREKKTA